MLLLYISCETSVLLCVRFSLFTSTVHTNSRGDSQPTFITGIIGSRRQCNLRSGLSLRYVRDCDVKVSSSSCTRSIGVCCCCCFAHIRRDSKVGEKPKESDHALSLRLQKWKCTNTVFGSKPVRENTGIKRARVFVGIECWLRTYSGD